MDRLKLIDIMDTLHQERMALMEGKGQDYSTEDVLSNFKRMSKMCSLLEIAPAQSPVDCALFLMLLKIDRWCNLRRSGADPKNESLADTIKDLHNYIDLAYACELESTSPELVDPSAANWIIGAPSSLDVRKRSMVQ